MNIRKLTALLCAAVMMLAGCSEPPKNLTESNPDTFSAEEGEFVFDQDLLRNSASLDLEGMEHLKAAEDMVILTPDTDKVYEFGYAWTDLDVFSRRDELGKVFLGEDYDSSLWREEKETLYNDEEKIRGFYEPKDWEGYFMADTNSSLFYQTDRSWHPLGSQKKTDEQLIEDDGTEYKLSDGSSITYNEAVDIADGLMEGFESAFGREKANVTEVRYDPDEKAVTVDYFQRVHGMKICEISEEMEIHGLEPSSEDKLGAANTPSSLLKRVYVYGRDKVFFQLSGGEIDTSDINEYDKIITLRSAMECLDDYLAVNMEFEVRRAELKYLLTTEMEELDGKTVLFKHKSGIPVWEVRLYNTREKREYAYLINTVSGEFSLVKLIPNS
ncbi:MAG: hypothetical protein IKP95_02720 [Ruminococcus sp.]|nr:hypothetical protein [Ruminococcus sp.]